MAKATSSLKDLIAAFRLYAEERKRPRVCPVCDGQVTATADGGLFACGNLTCGWQGTSPDRA